MAADTTDPHLALQAAALRLLREMPLEQAVGAIVQALAELPDNDVCRVVGAGQRILSLRAREPAARVTRSRFEGDH